jgi:hypothetical protein
MKIFARKYWGLVMVFYLLSLNAVSLFAQRVSTTPVTIEVSDVTDAAIPQAQIKLDKLQVNSEGRLSLNLPAGNYEVSVSARAF